MYEIDEEKMRDITPFILTGEFTNPNDAFIYNKRVWWASSVFNTP